MCVCVLVCLFNYISNENFATYRCCTIVLHLFPRISIEFENYLANIREYRFVPCEQTCQTSKLSLCLKFLHFGLLTHVRCMHFVWIRRKDSSICRWKCVQMNLEHGVWSGASDCFVNIRPTEYYEFIFVFAADGKAHWKAERRAALEVCVDRYTECSRVVFYTVS